jgi:hypothetical protein
MEKIICWNPSKLADLIHLKQCFEMCQVSDYKHVESHFPPGAPLPHISRHLSASECSPPVIFLLGAVRTPHEPSVKAWVTVCYLLVSFQQKCNLQCRVTAQDSTRCGLLTVTVRWRAGLWIERARKDGTATVERGIAISSAYTQ